MEQWASGSVPTEEELNDGRMPADWGNALDRSSGSGAASSEGPSSGGGCERPSKRCRSGIGGNIAQSMVDGSD
eukprot:11177658-Lingulodinium_polyedra.AAC.1